MTRTLRVFSTKEGYSPRLQTTNSSIKCMQDRTEELLPVHSLFTWLPENYGILPHTQEHAKREHKKDRHLP